jgi:thiol-disulfide isomerase/thioredoxin
MKFFLVFLGVLISISSLDAQSIKKMSIIDLENYITKSDHPILVNFWATYCVPCVAEIPYFQKEVKKYKNIELVLVSLDLPDDYPSKIASFAKKKNFTASICWLNETNADYFCPKIDKSWSGAIPSSLFVNNKTGYKKFFEGELTITQLQENCRALLKE